MKIEDSLTKLARRMKEGDEGAASAIYEELFDKVYGFAMNRVRRRDAAEEISQEIFTKLVFKISTFDPETGPFAPWFWRLAGNTVTDFYRARRTESFSDIPEEKYDIPSTRDSPEAAAENSILQEKLSAFMADLSPEEQEAFELRYVADLPYRDIAKTTGRKAGALRVAVSRIKSKIKKHFEEA